MKLAPQYMFVIMASVKSVPFRLASSKFAPSRFAPAKDAFERSAWVHVLFFQRLVGEVAPAKFAVAEILVVCMEQWACSKHKS